MLLVGVSGKRGSGKTSTVKLAIQQLRDAGINAIRASFASRLKAVCGALYGIPEELLYGDDDAKETVMPCGHTVRHILQFIAESARQLDPDVWVRGALADVRDRRAAVAIFDDMRYRNEAAQVAYTARLMRCKPTPDYHISEVDLDDYPFDLLIPNHVWNLATSAAALANKVKELYRGHRV